MFRVQSYIEIFSDCEIEFQFECVQKCARMLDSGLMTADELDDFLQDFILGILRAAVRDEEPALVGLSNDELDEWVQTAEKGIYQGRKVIVNPTIPKNYFILN